MTIADPAQHWDATYAGGDEGRSWYQPHATTSARLIADTGIAKSEPVVDIGGGASTLVDDLVADSYRDITVLDVSGTGLAIARRRLGRPVAAEVSWVVADVLTWVPPRAYGLWHDRAVLHFLTTPGQQQAYAHTLLAATRPGSHAVIGVFGPGGPTTCSGLAVSRFDPDGVMAVLGAGFDLMDACTQDHRTPAGDRQEFVWVRAVRTR
jgi:hypothetical protein